VLNGVDYLSIPVMIGVNLDLIWAWINLYLDTVVFVSLALDISISTPIGLSLRRYMLREFSSAWQRIHLHRIFFSVYFMDVLSIYRLV
jgi:hypothetical protein